MTDRQKWIEALADRLHGLVIDPAEVRKVAQIAAEWTAAGMRAARKTQPFLPLLWYEALTEMQRRKKP